MPGAERLRDSAPLLKLLQKQIDAKKLYAAVCASPAVVFQVLFLYIPFYFVFFFLIRVQHHGLLEGKVATCHPNFEDKLKDKSKVCNKAINTILHYFILMKVYIISKLFNINA